MKHLTKSICLLLAALLILGLFGCGEKPVESTAPTETTAPMVPEIDLTGEWANRDLLQEGFFLDGAYYHTRGGTLQHVDLSTGISTPVCAKENCSHANKLCEAIVPNMFWIYHNKKFYFLDYENTLSSRNPDGTEITKIGALGKEYRANNTHFIFAYDVIFTSAFVYYAFERERMISDEDFNFYTLKESALFRMDLATGKEELLVSYEDTIINLFAAQDERALFCTSRQFSEEEQSEDDFEELQNESPCVLQAWDADYEGVVTLLEKPYGEFRPFTLDGGKLGCSNKGHEIMLYDLETDTYSEYEAYTRPVYGGKYTIEHNTENYTSWIQNTETGEILYDENPDLNIRVVASNEDGFIITRHKTVFSEDLGYSVYLYSITYYIRYDELADGLQETDGLELWRVDYT